jgi:hypothetical protein
MAGIFCTFWLTLIFYTLLALFEGYFRGAGASNQAPKKRLKSGFSA